MRAMLGPKKERRDNQEGTNTDPVMTGQKRIMVRAEAIHFVSPGG
jgi:hypothetical protein